MIPELTQELIDALKNQQQIDVDGTNVGVSRQALDDAIIILQSMMDEDQ